MDLSIDADHYNNASDFADDYLVTEIMRKSVNLPLGIDKTQKALDSFWESERRCALTNSSLWSEKPEWFRSFRYQVRSVLGYLSRKDLRFVEDNFRFGPGATTGVRGSGSVKSDKFDEEIHLTEGLIPFYRTILGDPWWDTKKNPEVVLGSRFTTVPKNAKTDRGICVEPTLNSFVQLGIGALLRNRLKRASIDLNDQGRNQSFARRAWVDGLCTIDLSQASDSVSWSLVSEVLPPRWFRLLNLARSPFVEVGGATHELQKFSSMGNGYTFELESLLFLGVIRTFVPEEYWSDVTVYGDDLIFPRRYAKPIIDALNYLGFKVNESKSFLAGNFFESCGTDWFKGVNVRPFYLREDDEVKGTPYPLHIANQLRLWTARWSDGQYSDSRFKVLWELLLTIIPHPWRKCYVPPALGNAGIIDSTPQGPRCESVENTFVTKFIILVPVRRRKKTIGHLMMKLSQRNSNPLLGWVGLASSASTPFREKIIPIKPLKGFEPVRGYLGKFRTRTRPQQWVDVGLVWL
jgi:hypothetical protein